MVSGRWSWELFIFLFFINAFLIKPVFASTIDGTVSSGYAWSSRVGWINFAASNGNVHITDSVLTGSAWSDLYGWIKLDPSTSGVTNNGEGDLAGSAWGANIGWIDFSGVGIGSDGIFYGTASGTNVGIINFSCTNCLVQTDWRPYSIRSAAQPAVAFPVTVGGASAISTATSTEIVSNILVSSSAKQNSKSTRKNSVNSVVLKNSTKTIVAKLLTPEVIRRWTYIDPKILQRFIFSPAKDKFLSFKNEALQAQDSPPNTKTSKLKNILFKAYSVVYETKNIVSRFVGNIIGDKSVICKIKVC